jgi:hypothetical protein
MTDATDDTRRDAEAVDRHFRKTRRRAFLAWSVCAAGMLLMASVGRLRPESRSAPGILAVGLVAVGCCAGLFCALQAYHAWALHRVLSALLLQPAPSAVRAEHRQARLLAGAFGSAAVAGVALMSVANEHRWTGPLVAVLFVGGCAGALHFLQVVSATRRLQAILQDNE